MININLARVTHDRLTNTLEATWLEETPSGYVPHRCVNYCAAQRADFESDLGVDIAAPYIVMAGW